MSAEIKDLIDSLGYLKVESHELYYHRSLTREVIVYDMLDQRVVHIGTAKLCVSGGGFDFKDA